MSGAVPSGLPAMGRELLAALATVSASRDHVTARLDVPDDLGVLDGHFPADPILPGAHLVECARALVERARERPMTIRAVERARFTAVVRPGARLELEVDIEDEGVAEGDGWDAGAAEDGVGNPGAAGAAEEGACRAQATARDPAGGDVALVVLRLVAAEEHAG